LCCGIRENRSMAYISVEETAHPRPNPALAFQEKSAVAGEEQTQFESAVHDTASSLHAAQHVQLLVCSSTPVLYSEEVREEASSYSTEAHQTHTASPVSANMDYSIPKRAPVLVSVGCVGNVTACDVLTVLTPTA